jgi:alkylation response protein AidB-like acyl-CoA dehydrogenase
MYVDYTPDQKALRDELADYFSHLITPEVRAELGPMHGGETFSRIVRRMGADGWLGVGWPREYGGQGRTAIEQQIFIDEARKAGAPIPFVTLSTVGPALIAIGTDEQKQEFLPGILAGELHFAIGYTEPESGTDLASLSTSAVKQGDEWIINGTKVFTSGADHSDYIWLAARTDPDVKKHRGITLFIVDTKQPGFRATPIHTLGGGHTTMTYYDDVRVPDSRIVGKVHGGWKVITLQLNHERMGLAAFAGQARLHMEQVAAWARETEVENGRPLAETPWVQLALGECFARLEALKVLNWRMAWELEAGRLDPAHASAVKVYGSECVIEVYRLLHEVLGPAGTLRRDSPGALLRGDIEQASRGAPINTFGGGVNEVQREIIAMLGLGMPRSPR